MHYDTPQPFVTLTSRVVTSHTYIQLNTHIYPYIHIPYIQGVSIPQSYSPLPSKAELGNGTMYQIIM